MFVNVLYDIILVCLVLAGLAIGYHRGFVMLILRSFRSIGALLLALVSAKGVASLFRLADKIAAPVEAMLTEYITVDATHTTVEKIPTVLKGLLNLFGVDLSQMLAEAPETFVSRAVEPVANAFAVVLAFVGTYFFGLLLLWVASKFINAVFQLPLLKQINSVAGALIGFVFYSFIAWVAVKLTVFAFGLFPNSALFDSFNITKTLVGEFFYNLKPLDLLLSF